ncbi:hypothetical protein L2E82_03396 [Cichorium intybus]|uniref:Uncharacterized protein n=1 Tax=Cichorium intybus TaxID=13427 RepID=A0ACB9H4P1_CICIN|nr:hypothetical protein L2E82_03396 [Cichorium intybus]
MVSCNQLQLGWKTVLHLLSITVRHQDTYERGVKELINLMADGLWISVTDYPYCIDCMFGFVVLRNSLMKEHEADGFDGRFCEIDRRMEYFFFSSIHSDYYHH